MKWIVPCQEKLVSFLQGRLGEYSGKSIRRLLEANVCRINGRIERFGSRVVKSGDAVELASSWTSALAPRLASFSILYEDEDFKIVDKPTRWVCLDLEVKKAFGPGHYLVHRLDKDTTGALILAKHPAVREGVIDLFEKRAVEKSYLAVVDGIPQDKGGVRQSYLMKKRSFQGQTIWGSGPKGLTAITHWQLLAQGKKGALLLCKPQTGRTHQIRVHLAEMGHPLLVDRQYASSFRCSLFIQRPLLHAYRVSFLYRDKKIEAEAPLPLDIREALRGLGVEMGHLSQLLRQEEHDNGWNQSHSDKDAKEIEKPSCLIH